MNNKQNVAAKKGERKEKKIGAGTLCPRCEDYKPRGTCGNGISLSRRGPAAICSQCGAEEALIDARIIGPDPGVMMREQRLHKVLGKRAHAYGHSTPGA